MKPELQKVFNLPPCKILSFQIFLKIMLFMSFKIGFLFLVPADLALISHMVKPSSMTSHMVNRPHGWYPHTRSFFATLCEAKITLFEIYFYWIKGLKNYSITVF